MHRRQSQRGTSSWGFKSDPVLIALPVVCGDLKTQLLRVERFGLRHIGDCHHHHQNFFISHCHNLPFTCCKTACCVSFSTSPQSAKSSTLFPRLLYFKGVLLPLHLPVPRSFQARAAPARAGRSVRALHAAQPDPADRKSTRLNSSPMSISYAVF